jgi:chorismate mutase
MGGPPGGMDALRARIDAIDRELVALLGERAGCALAIGRLKEQAGMPVYQPAREADVLNNVRAANRGPLDNDAIVRLFERIIDEARRLERLAVADHGADTPPDAGTVEST